MSCNWMRRAMLALAAGTALLLGACGSGTIESQLTPTRFVVFGDGLSDLGQGGKRYTVNDSGLNIWTEIVATNYGVGLSSVVTGGTSYARGNARIVAKPDAAGSNATASVKEQIDTFLATNTVTATDIVIVSGGISDVIAEVMKVTAGTQTADQAIANAGQAGRDLAAQAKRIVAAGGTHVVVVGTYNLGRSPWATSIAQNALLEQVSGKLNEELLVALVDQGNNMLYVDAALEFNLMAGSPASFDMINAVNPVCTSVDPGPGIGIGAGQINSALCTPTTILPAALYNTFLYADPVYFTPQGHRKFGDYAYSRIHSRW